MTGARLELRTQAAFEMGPPLATRLGLLLHTLIPNTLHACAQAASTTPETGASGSAAGGGFGAAPPRRPFESRPAPSPPPPPPPPEPKVIKKTVFANISASLLRPTKAFLVRSCVVF